MEDEEVMEEDELLEDEKRVLCGLREREEEECLVVIGMMILDFWSFDWENFGMVGLVKLGWEGDLGLVVLICGIEFV